MALKKGLSIIAFLAMVRYAIADYTDSPYFASGKLDLFYNYDLNNTQQVNTMVWTPVFKGGYGVTLPEHGAAGHYFGGFVRPILNDPTRGELILGAQSVVTGDAQDVDVQGEFRFPFGLGFGAGFVNREQSVEDVAFAKITFRRVWQDVHYFLTLQWQRYGNRDSPGGYAAFYDGPLMLSWGSDGEQWRSAVAYVAPDRGGDTLRPALEVFYVDNSIGVFQGPKLWLISGSLGYRNGFLGHQARLGRVMGPTGLEFSNPLSFLRPTFNRRLNSWELGDYADFRLLRQESPDGRRSETWEAVAYPLQIAGVGGLWNALFIGMSAENPKPGSTGYSALFGYHGRIEHLESSLRLQHDFSQRDTALFFSLIHWL
ncbi:MAG: hypothetical protein ACU84J_13615 [Gammaproteobacteria bacterium]